MRRYDEPVEVRTSTGRPTAAPDQFVWRGRLYVVRDVLSCWVETGAWWRGPAAQRVHGGDGVVADGLVESCVDDSADEHTTWRVEASAGRRAGSGVYDLCERTPGVWRLVQALD